MENGKCSVASDDFLFNIGGPWAGSDPVGASAWAKSLPEGEMRNRILGNMVPSLAYENVRDNAVQTVAR
jgi:hypothetical protein